MSQGVVLRQILQACVQLLALDSRGHLSRYILQQILVLLGVTLFPPGTLDHQRTDNSILGGQGNAQP